jgi:hypothetical protein
VSEKIAELPITRIHAMLSWNFATPQTDLARSQVSTHFMWTLEIGLLRRLSSLYGLQATLTINSSKGNHVVLDYALIARIPHSKTGEPLIAITGVTQYGTRAAAEFVTSASALRDLLKSAPKDWMSKNMEFVLQTKVVNDIPTNPTVVAIRSW